MPAEQFDLHRQHVPWHADSYGFVGYLDGKPAACTAAFPGPEPSISHWSPHRIGRHIALVATLPEDADDAARDRNGPSGVSRDGLPGPRLVFPGLPAQ